MIATSRIQKRDFRQVAYKHDSMLLKYQEARTFAQAEISTSSSWIGNYAWWIKAIEVLETSSDDSYLLQSFTAYEDILLENMSLNIVSFTAFKTTFLTFLTTLFKVRKTCLQDFMDQNYIRLYGHDYSMYWEKGECSPSCVYEIVTHIFCVIRNALHTNSAVSLTPSIKYLRAQATLAVDSLLSWLHQEHDAVVVDMAD